jgi:hypothetical protein
VKKDHLETIAERLEEIAVQLARLNLNIERPEREGIAAQLAGLNLNIERLIANLDIDYLVSLPRTTPAALTPDPQLGSYIEERP